MLRAKFDHAYRAVMWLRKNQHLFEGKVYEPMILEVISWKSISYLKIRSAYGLQLNVADSDNAKYFENIIPVRDLVAFTCERKVDMEILHKKLRTDESLNINIVHSAASDQVNFQPKRPINQLQWVFVFSHVFALPIWVVFYFALFVVGNMDFLHIWLI